MHHTLQTTEGKWSPSAAHPCFPFWASLGPRVPNADNKELNYLPSRCALAFAKKLACQIANCSSFCLLPLQKPPVCHANTLQFPACEFNLRSSVSTNAWNLDQVWCRCLHSHPSSVQQKSLNMSFIFCSEPKHLRTSTWGLYHRVPFQSFLTGRHFAVREKPTAEVALMVFTCGNCHNNEKT